MTRWRRRPAALAAMIGALGGALLLAVVLVALDLDVLSMILGAAIVAVAFVIIIGVWLEPGARARRKDRQRQRRAEKMDRKRSVRTRRVIHAAERRLYWQLEALAWLRDGLDLQRPLRATRGAAAAPDALLELIRLIDASDPEVVVELGSGVSTVVTAARLKARGKGRVVALEHEPKYAAATREELRVQGLEHEATVLDAPLVDVSIGEDHWQWYEVGAEVPGRIDLLFVDGPPGGTGPLARYPALPQLHDRLTPGAKVFADDGDRPDEREMVQRWAAENEGVTVEELPLVKGAWLLTMPE